MRRRAIVAAGLFMSLAALGLWTMTARADGGHHEDNGGLQNVNHIIIVMQENHSFDNYFGALPYVPGGPYHQCRNQDHGGNFSRMSDFGGGPGNHGGEGDHGNDHQCVDGLTCKVDSGGNFTCENANLDDDGSIVHAFHEQKFCTGPDLDHSWSGSHIEGNFNDPAATLFFSPNDGFVRRNDATIQGQPDSGPETPNSDDTMGFYTQADLPFYYNLAQTFAIDDRYFCSVIGQTFPNRAYEVAATSFGHLTTSEIIQPGGYKPITGTIYDLLDANHVTWTNYFSDVPLVGIFRPSAFPFIVPPQSLPLTAFLAQAAAGTLPSVSFVDPNLGFVFGPSTEDDEHPPTDIRKGEDFVSEVVNAVRNGPNWKDSIIFITYDEHGGFYDHVQPAPAPQDGKRNPDGIDPGQCADLSSPPLSEVPGNGVQCTISRMEALAICATFTDFGAYPHDCANFDQLGFRVPFIAVSPFSKPHYVSHTVGDHTSMLALIEERFLSTHHGFFESHQSLTERDESADPLLDMFDFEHSPSLNTPVTTAPAASPTDPGCPFVKGGPQG
jgi:phospholipase C